jgi:hypothetical protein
MTRAMRKTPDRIGGHRRLPRAGVKVFNLSAVHDPSFSPKVYAMRPSAVTPAAIMSKRWEESMLRTLATKARAAITIKIQKSRGAVASQERCK